MSRIEALTTEQVAQFPVIRDKWLGRGLSTEPADRAAAEEGVRLAYQAANIEPPKFIVWLRSPLEGAVGAAFLKIGGTDQVWDQVRAQVWDQVGAQVWDQVWDQVGAQVRAQVGAQVGDQVRAQVWDQVRAQVWDQVGAQVWAQVWDQVGAQVGDQVRDQVGAQVWAQVWDQVWAQVRAQVGAQVGRCGYGQHDASWLGFYEAFSFLPITERLRGIAKISENSGWWWPFKNFCILTDRPCHLSRDDQGRLHCEDRAALEYRDGWGIYAWHGVRVSDWIILHPDRITVELIDAEQNAEVRRVMMERFGFEKYLLDGNAETLDHEEGVGTLYRKAVADDEPLVMVSVINSTPEPDGSWKRYTLRVHPECRPLLANNELGDIQKLTARNAIASTFGLTGKQYHPQIET